MFFPEIPWLTNPQMPNKNVAVIIAKTDPTPTEDQPRQDFYAMYPIRWGDDLDEG